MASNENVIIEDLLGGRYRALPKIKEVEKSDLPLPNEYVGIEVEAENYGGLTIAGLNDWVVDSDNSLRNNGVEFISNPIRVWKAEGALHSLFKAQNNVLDFSKRTSIHIHMNVRDMTLAELRTLLMVYSVFEKPLFRFAGEQRQYSIFCVPLLNCLLLKNFTNGVTVDTFNMWEKYSALNLVPILKQGTVEFRHMEGNQDIDRICTWINLLCCLKKYAKSLSPEEALKRISNLTTSSEYYLYAINVFGPLINAIFPNGKFNLRELDDSVKYLKAFIFKTNFVKVSTSSLYYQEEPKAKLTGANKIRFSMDDLVLTTTIPLE